MNRQAIEQTKFTSKHPLVKHVIGSFKRDLKEIIESVEPKSVLDAGCGEGIISQYILSQFNFNMCGIDLSGDMLHKSSKILPVVCASAHKLPFKDKTFDLVICLEVLEHIDMPEKGLLELARVGEYAIISVPNDILMRIGNISRGKYLRNLGNFPDHINHWTYFSFKKLLQEYFDILDMRISGLVWLIALVKSKKLRKRGL